MTKRVLTAMSGGVDSTMAAVLLQEQGYDVVGATLEMTQALKCCLIFEAKATCADLGVPHHTIDATELFEDTVIQPYLDDIRNARTPSPCIRCNPILKFGFLLERGRELGCEYIATGHYAQIVEIEGRYHIKKGVDLTKDQSYFLYMLTQDQLKHTIFPLGQINKTQIREWCRAKKLPSAEQSDSQDLCFVPREGPLPFIEERLPELVKPGRIVTVDGEVLGKHQGYHRYTIGQRKGLGLHGGPWFVAEIRRDANEVVVGRRDDVLGDRLELTDVNWQLAPPSDSIRCNVRIRYNHREIPATVIPTSESTATVEFDEPQFAITPGQGAAFYDGDIVLGGGWIE